MPKGTYLGEFELLVLAALVRLDDDAYAVTIKRDIEQRAKRPASLGAIHAAIGRLSDKGFVALRMSDPLPVQGGRLKGFMTGPLSEAEAVARMIDGLELGARS